MQIIGTQSTGYFCTHGFANTNNYWSTMGPNKDVVGSYSGFSAEVNEMQGYVTYTWGPWYSYTWITVYVDLQTAYYMYYQYEQGGNFYKAAYFVVTSFAPSATFTDYSQNVLTYPLTGPVYTAPPIISGQW